MAFNLIALLFVAGLVTAGEQSPNLGTGNTIYSSECGGVFEGATLDISYKVGENLTADETCIWVFRTPVSTDYAGAILQLGFTNTTSGVHFSLSGVGHGYTLNEYIPTNNGLYNLNNVSFVVVKLTTLESVDASAKGFQLQLSGFSNSHVTKPAVESTDQGFQGNWTSVRYPPSGNITTSNHHSTLLFLPEYKGMNVSITYVRVNDVLNNFGYVYFYYLNKYSDTLWINGGNVGYSNELKTISAVDAILAVYQGSTGNARPFFITKACGF